MRDVAFRIWGDKLSQGRLDNAANVPASDAWEEQVARMDTSFDEGPKSVDGAKELGRIWSLLSRSKVDGECNRRPNSSEG